MDLRRVTAIRVPYESDWIEGAPFEQGQVPAGDASVPWITWTLNGVTYACPLSSVLAMRSGRPRA